MIKSVAAAALFCTIELTAGVSSVILRTKSKGGLDMDVSYPDGIFLVLSYLVMIGLIVGMIALGVSLYRDLKRH